MIRKEVVLSPAVMEQLETIVRASNILQVDDSAWKEPSEHAKQELECKIDQHHIAFMTGDDTHGKRLEQGKDIFHQLGKHERRRLFTEIDRA